MDIVKNVVDLMQIRRYLGQLLYHGTTLPRLLLTLLPLGIPILMAVLPVLELTAYMPPKDVGRRVAKKLTRDDARELVRSRASFLGSDPNLMEAIATIESGLNESALSKKGAVGLMQVMPSTAKAMKKELDIRFPLDNVDMGVAIYQRGRKELEGVEGASKTLMALADYHLGRPKLLKLGVLKDGKFNIDKLPQETKNYIVAIIDVLNLLKARDGPR